MPIELTGMKELLANLERVAKNVQQVRYKALLAGAEVIRKAMSEKAPRGSEAEALAKKYSPGKHAADNIAISQPKQDERGESVDVGPAKGDNDDFFYMKFFEWGAAAHDEKITRGPYAGMTVHHPGIKAKPFAEPALIENREKALGAMAEVIKEAIERV